VLGGELPLGPLTIKLTQRVPFVLGTTTTYGDTLIGLEYAIALGFKLALSDRLVYEPNGVRQVLNLGASGTFNNLELLRFLGSATPETPDTFGTTNIAASYDLDNLAGNAGRARVGLDTSLPLGQNWSAQLSSEAVADSTLTGSIGVGARYQGEGAQGSARAQLGFTPNGLKQVYTLGLIAKLSEELIVSPSLEYTALPTFETLPNGSSVRDGGRFSLAGAWRADDWSVLTNHIGRFGIAAPNGDFLQGEAQFGSNGSERLFLRFGGAYRYELTSSLITLQFGAGATWFLTNEFGIGANGAVLWQPSTDTSKIAFGLEASYRLTTGLIGTVGFNFVGYNGFGTFSTAPGLYFRLDFIFDERTFGWR
jgi:hypothetical protein